LHVLPRRSVAVRFAPVRGSGSRSQAFLSRAKSRLMQCSKMASLFDHLVGRDLQGQRDLDAERLGGLEIDHQLKLCRLLDG
jgi:hypothetical protein